MKSVIQRVNEADVKIDGEICGKIKKGIVILLGVCDEDTETDMKWLADKIMGLRIFTDENGKMNLPLSDVNGELLIISQFTLFGDCRKGRRPDFTSAGKPEHAKEMYEKFIDYCSERIPVVQTGRFGADMCVSLENDGPVTLILDSKA